MAINNDLAKKEWYTQLMETIKVQVTQDHILKGIPGKAACCPIALALKDMGFQCVEVNIDNISFVDGPVSWDCDFTPSSVDGFITTFDTEGASGVEPFEFHLERTTDYEGEEDE